jgi:HPt (histidine-containing phosphotransfer) domain-containing protein
MGESVENALTEIWRRSGPLLEKRLTAIELAVAELSGQCVEPILAEAGRDQAHMLAGVLGTFGLARGTALARDLEEHLGRPQAGEEAGRLAHVAAELRAVVDGAADA